MQRRLRAVRQHLAAAQTASAVELPGRLGDPSLFIHTDPRTDPRIAAQMVAEGITAAADVDTSQFTTNAERARFVNEFELASAERKEDNPRGAGGVPADVEAKTVSTELTIGGVDGNEIRLVMKRPLGSETTPLPCYYHTHGGGMCMMGVDDPSFVALYTTLAAEGVCVIGVEFRNSAGGLVYGPDAPLAPFPAGINDCMSGLQYVFDHKEELAVTTIVVSGESGGGNLSSALALKAKRENRGPLIDGVYAMCPYISGTYDPAPPELASVTENAGYLGGISNAVVQLMADVYTADGTDDALDPVAWPLRATQEDLAGLPPHVISVNELDPLRDEGLAYFRKLRQAGVSARARVVVGTTHASDCPGRYFSAVPDVAEATTQDILHFIRTVSAG